MSRNSKLLLKASVLFTCLTSISSPTLVSADFYLGNLQRCNHYQSGMWVSRGAVWNLARSRCGNAPFYMDNQVTLYANNRWKASARSRHVPNQRTNSVTVKYQCSGPVPYINEFTSRSTFTVVRNKSHRAQQIANRQISGHKKRLGCS